MNAKLLAAVAALGLLSACSGEAASESAAAQAKASVSGAGATFPAPLYAKWAEAYRTEGDVAVNYQPVGSGDGIKQIEAGKVDFGASDRPLQPEELDKNGLYQFPTVIGGVVPVVNLPGIQPGQVKLTGAVLGDIYLGKLEKWNAPEIVALNPGLTLPNLRITPVHRSDASGTSFLFTSYLAMKNPAWSAKVGASDSVTWPAGISGQGNEGVASSVQVAPGSIGYVEYAFAKQTRAIHVLLQNSAGAYPQPSARSFAAAALGADWAHAPGNYLLLLDQAGAPSWPITGATFILLPKNKADAAKRATVLQFFDWAYRNGDQAAGRLDYVPLPQSIKERMRQQWASTITANGKPVYTIAP
ncbi:MAG: phosphate ABC transporter substrate-binding protein PstS [Sphingomonas sp.]|uniref:phosphate ABC transporter substrate-binding protein PstS n=1 Tax=Sphingomonas sp. TaxID=28214 RepID=UPI003567143A